MQALSLLALISVVAAAPVHNRNIGDVDHKPHHRHQDKRNVGDNNAAYTVVEYIGGDGKVYSTATIDDSTASTAESTQSATGAPAVALVNNDVASSASASASASATATSATATSASATATATSSDDSSSSDDDSSSSSSSSGISGDLSSFSNPTEKFQDGTVKCSSFPSGQGVISLSWVGYNDWASIMNMDGETSSSCEPGYYCSYACQAGMSKTQWPSEQPNDGRSVGGLYCGKDGYLYRSNTDSDYLCEWGVESAFVKSQVDKDISLCRTDYPGSENMVLPTLLQANDDSNGVPLSVVNEDSYYKWQGKPTSSQYYVNNAGVSVEDGCIWGTSSGSVGNWAPLVIGSGSSNGVTYLSLIPNPNNNDAPNYSVKIVGRDGSSTVGDCKYENGKYNGDGTDGCTFSVSSGIADIVFY
ncbi:putative secreted beta-glucosidase SUN4 [Hanseniaspora osmophila]|uniref:Putative secreted beta-glucosidase SUN4 n=1 Tax=Hanseniaspora osmophila TaxID=56408 RepID=A0A1E5R558_9ASCO|nr:putative secreted beta-glucosidase SUN4 [Hanseniaspora osmophila]